MGRVIHTNIKHEVIDRSRTRDLTIYIKDNPIIILDNVEGKSYFPVFDNFYIKDKKYLPICISTYWEMGGGGAGPETETLISFLTKPESSLFLPTIIVNAVFASLADRLLIQNIIRLVGKLKRSDSTKRPRVAYYSKNGRLSNYEFPSFASKDDIKKGLMLIPKYAIKAKHDDYYVYDSKNRKWVRENN